MREGCRLEFEQMLTLEPFIDETCQARGGSLAPNLPAWHTFSAVIAWAKYLCG